MIPEFICEEKQQIMTHLTNLKLISLQDLSILEIVSCNSTFDDAMKFRRFKDVLEYETLNVK